MTEEKLFARADVAALPGIDNDVLQFWLREGLLQPEPFERRKHRRFKERELRIALLLGEARSMGLNVAALRAIGEACRDALVFREELRASLGGDPSAEQETEAVEGVEQYDKLMLAWDIGFGNGSVGVSPNGDGTWEVRHFREDHRAHKRSELVLYLEPIFEGHFE